ncbi:MAG: Asp-tRNA(Asn)/Glu-tRNA(Gln) amidotransferase subunit GatC [Anaerolineae bacterium]|jgi:aspartyl-tRNA(Asn)/glutamyl-tRNA(Gln) amidotransferase subunit C|nr:Asp-tRNA(Asn)/Glu-tRNA(Gln) amidotransferase subunit GatC [Anaerolineae bacterium]MBT7074832.1 Asp-tRNA(Asn)/Glu-tRNA(Gln) amidotransferase subunit GatC [Anaerolineae bacterium]MBT7782968.1 Asp-tRNA(Asn)/Glu-tRNA(Gln) amidotransferase subunit GatC [Anaerolineae bacterium]
MSLNLEEVKHIAKLARLNLTAEEEARYREQLSDILGHIAKLSELNTEGISPTANAIEEATPIRADISRKSLATVELFKNAPDADKNQFKVPAVFGEQK